MKKLFKLLGAVTLIFEMIGCACAIIILKLIFPPQHSRIFTHSNQGGLL